MTKQISINKTLLLVNHKVKRSAKPKAAKTYYGNGQVVWTDGKVTLALKKDAQPQQAAPSNALDPNDLLFRLTPNRVEAVFLYTF